MSIQRVPEVPFAQIANSALRDTRLSFKARGLLALVLSNVGDWEASRSWLMNQSEKDGRHAIQEALNELTELGYREVRKVQENGKVRSIVEWRHEPNVSISRPTENLTVREPDGQETRRYKEHHPKEHHRLEHKKDIFRFEEFWKIYPKRVGRKAAATKWQTAVKTATPDQIIEAAKRYRDNPKRDPEFTANPATWLNQERWLDEYEKPKVSGPVTVMDLYAAEPCEHGDPMGESRCALCRRK